MSYHPLQYENQNKTLQQFHQQLNQNSDQKFYRVSIYDKPILKQENRKSMEQVKVNQNVENNNNKLETKSKMAKNDLNKTCINISKAQKQMNAIRNHKKLQNLQNTNRGLNSQNSLNSKAREFHSRETINNNYKVVLKGRQNRAKTYQNLTKIDPQFQIESRKLPTEYIIPDEQYMYSQTSFPKNLLVQKQKSNLNNNNINSQKNPYNFCNYILEKEQKLIKDQQFKSGKIQNNNQDFRSVIQAQKLRELKSLTSFQTYVLNKKQPKRSFEQQKSFQVQHKKTEDYKTQVKLVKFKSISISPDNTKDNSDQFLIQKTVLQRQKNLLNTQSRQTQDFINSINTDKEDDTIQREKCSRSNQRKIEMNKIQSSQIQQNSHIKPKNKYQQLQQLNQNFYLQNISQNNNNTVNVQNQKKHNSNNNISTNIHNGNWKISPWQHGQLQENPTKTQDQNNNKNNTNSYLQDIFDINYYVATQQKL